MADDPEDDDEPRSTPPLTREELAKVPRATDGLMRSIERASSGEHLMGAARRAMQDFERSLHSEAMRDAVRWQEELARMAEPSWPLKEALAEFEANNSFAATLRAQAEALDAFRSPMAEFFRQQDEFATGSMARLFDEIKASSAFDLARLIPEPLDMSALMGDTFSAAAALAEVRSIGIGVSAGLGFDEDFAAALRIDVGDWRDEISWPPSLESSSEVRESIYVDRGLVLNVDVLPAESIERVFGLAVAESAEDEQPLAIVLPANADRRAQEGFQMVRRLEMDTRRFVDALMTRAFGKTWPDSKVTPKTRDEWREKQRKAVKQGRPAGRLIDFADFMDYQGVICLDGNWTRVFEVGFVRKENVRESFQRLHPVRLALMHSRDITNEDLLYLMVEAGRLRSCLERLATAP